MTADDLPAGVKRLPLQTRLNGRTLQDASTGAIMSCFPKPVAVISEGITLEPGGLIGTGMPTGVGLGCKPPPATKPGDVCEVATEHVGILRNPFANETP